VSADPDRLTVAHLLQRLGFSDAQQRGDLDECLRWALIRALSLTEQHAEFLETGCVLMPIVVGETKREYGARLAQALADKMRGDYP
jgi:hypothetical protein